MNRRDGHTFSHFIQYLGVMREHNMIAKFYTQYIVQFKYLLCGECGTRRRKAQKTVKADLELLYKENPWKAFMFQENQPGTASEAEQERVWERR